MSLTNKIYNIPRNNNKKGDVFTSPKVACYILDLIGYTSNKDLSQYKILEPSCGEGVFILEIIQRIISSAKIYGFNANNIIAKNIIAYDIDSQKIEECQRKIRNLFPSVALPSFRIKDFLADNLSEKFDFIVGNPPYIRYERIPSKERALYKQKFLTFHYRADLYILFFEKTLKCLKIGGKHSFICANRWLKNEYGKKLRGFIANSYCLQSIINLENANAFQDNVLAYPAITIISNDSPAQQYKYTELDSIQNLGTNSFQTRNMSSSDDWCEMFHSFDTYSSLLSIEEQGFHIGIGIATGADKIYISSTLKERVEPELLLPAINAKDLTGNCLNWKGEYLLNPFDEKGNLIDLSSYPKAHSYLESKKEILSNRYVAKKNPTKWYRTIDKVKTGLQNASKILIPDISGNSLLFIDEGHFYPLHNIYYITGKDIEQQKILCAILMSNFVKEQMNSFSNNMNGGYARWQSQNLRKLRIPYINGISPDLLALLKEGYDKKNFKIINECMTTLTTNMAQRGKVKALNKPQQLAFTF